MLNKIGLNNTLFISAMIVVTLVTTGCTLINSSKPQRRLPSPPIELNPRTNESTNAIKTNVHARNSTNKIESKPANNYVPFSKIEETRTNGGSITEIKVNNKDALPSYYIYPRQQPELYINNQQRNISTPTWQLSW